MKIRLFITLLAFIAAPAGAQTAQDAWAYLESQCGEHQIEIDDNGVATFTDNGDNSMTVNLKDVEKVTIDSDGDTALRCRKLKNPFAIFGERHACMQGGDETRSSGWYMFGCEQQQGVTRALHFLIKQHNPEVELNLDY